jgi:hypothetical protein
MRRVVTRSADTVCAEVRDPVASSGATAGDRPADPVGECIAVLRGG